MSHDDFETEPVPGLPAHLPKGEHIVWQGAPDASAFARSVLHERKIIAYFAIVAIWKAVTAIYDGGTLANAAISVSFMAMAALVVWAIIRWYASAVARTTIYTITNKRVVMRFGVALPVTFNYPFAQTTGANVKQLYADHGNITLDLKEHSKVSWAILWPHARPWRLAKPEPAMRAIAEVSNVATILARELHAFHNLPQPGRLMETRPSAEPAPSGAVTGKLSEQGA